MRQDSHLYIGHLLGPSLVTCGLLAYRLDGKNKENYKNGKEPGCPHTPPTCGQGQYSWRLLPHPDPSVGIAKTVPPWDPQLFCQVPKDPEPSPGLEAITGLQSPSPVQCHPTSWHSLRLAWGDRASRWPSHARSPASHTFSSPNSNPWDSLKTCHKTIRAWRLCQGRALRSPLYTSLGF